MAHYAKITDGTVTQVIVAEEEKLHILTDENPHDKWIKTSYNTYGGVHNMGGIPLRKNFAAIGYIYDEQRDAFIPPKAFKSWLLNEDTCLWEPPVPHPDDGKNYTWDEKELKWVEVVV